jgi:phosphoketolase
LSLVRPGKLACVTATGSAARMTLEAIDRYVRACDYLGAAQLYLRANALLRDRSGPSTSNRACSGTGERSPV